MSDNPTFYVKALYVAANISNTLLSGVVIALVSPRPNNKPKPIPHALRPIMAELLDAKPVSCERLSELEKEVAIADASLQDKQRVLEIITRKKESKRI
jgi:hypothetical protein